MFLKATNALWQTYKWNLKFTVTDLVLFIFYFSCKAVVDVSLTDLFSRREILKCMSNP